MSFTSSHLARVLLGATELAPYLSSARVTHNVEMLDSTTLNDTAKRSVAGLSGGELQVEGWSDISSHTATFTAISILDGILGTDTVVSYAPAGWTVGNPTTLAVARKQSTYEVGTAVGSLANFSLNVVGDGPVATGVSLHALTAETATGNGTSVDRAPVTSTALGAVAHIHCTAFSGITSIAVIVEDSANNSAWSTIGTFTTLTGTGQQRLSISGTVRRYVRCSWTIVGTGSATFQASVAPL